MSRPKTLSEVKDIYGNQRFYPVGQHPATHRYREMLKKLEALPDTREVMEARAWYERKLDEFEQGEDRAKRHYLDRIKSHRERTIAEGASE